MNKLGLVKAKLRTDLKEQERTMDQGQLFYGHHR